MAGTFVAIVLVCCYLVIGLGVLRGLRAWLNWRDARALQEFHAQCMEAEAIQQRIARRRGGSP